MYCIRVRPPHRPSLSALLPAVRIASRRDSLFPQSSIDTPLARAPLFRARHTMVRRASTRASAMRTTAFATIVAVLAPHAAHAGAFEATDKNFDSAVMNSGKHVFAKFLAPWCVFDDARDRE